MICVHATSARRAGWRRAVLTASLLVTGLAVSGCVRVNAALTVSGTDQVSGDVVVAAQPSAGSAQGPQLTVPPALKNRVTAKPYSADGFVGQDVAFHDLSFDEFSALTATAGAGGHYQLTLRRAQNDLVSFAGSADLTQVPADNSSVQVKVTFPGPVTQTDGQGDGDTVTWKLAPGQVNTFAATAQYASGGGLIRPWTFWATAVAGAGGLIAVFLVVLALWARRRNLRKEQPPPGPEPATYSGY
jgi:hypothetical protein